MVKTAKITETSAIPVEDAKAAKPVAPPASRNIHQRMNAAIAAAKAIGKDERSARDPSGRDYAFVTHDAVTDEAVRVLTEHGIHFLPTLASWCQQGNRTVVEIIGHFYNVDDPTDFIALRSFGYGHDDEDKGPGKAMSYAKKYCLLQGLLLRAGPEADPEKARVRHVPATEGDTGDFPGDKPIEDEGSIRGYLGDFGLGSIRTYTPGDFVAHCLTAVGQARSTDDIDDVYRRNKQSLDLLRERSPDQFAAIRSLAEGTRKKLVALA